MMKQGHSAQFVLQVHENFLDALSGVRDFREHKLDESSIKDLRGKSWVGNSFVDTEDARRSLATESGRAEFSNKFGADLSMAMFELVNSLEFAVRHSEVKDAVESFKQGNSADLLEDVEPRIPSSQRL